jgi:hypothetical protein
LDVLMEVMLETLVAFVGCAHGTDIFLPDDWLNGRGPDHFREPSEVGRAPMSPAHGPASVSKQAGCETERGVFESAEGIFTGAGEVPHGFLFHLGDIHRDEVPRAGQASPWHRVPAVGFDALARFLGNP